MSSYQLKKDEVIVYEGFVKFGKMNSNVKFTLTSRNMIFEKRGGMFKKKLRVIENIQIDKIKMYKNKVQIKQKKSRIIIQTFDKNIEFTCNGIFEAKKIITEIINIKTGSNLLDRTTKRANNATKVVKGAIKLTAAVAAIPPALSQLNKNKKKVVRLFKGMIKR